LSEIFTIDVRDVAFDCFFFDWVYGEIDGFMGRYILSVCSVLSRGKADGNGE
jgi:hypothetical protein